MERALAVEKVMFMKRLQKFRFDIPVNKIWKYPAKTVLIGNLEISGIADMNSEDYNIDYDSIVWEGKDIMPLLDNYDPASEFLQSIYDASYNHVRENYSRAVQIENEGIESLEEMRQDV